MERVLDNFQEQDPKIYSEKNIFFYGNVIEPLTKLEHVKFNENVRKNFLKKGYRSIFPIQRYSWNEIEERRSVVMVCSRGSGKTTGFLPSLLSLLERDMKAKEKENMVKEKENNYERCGPIAIVFVKSSREVEAIKHLCTELLTSPKLRIVSASGMWNLDKKKIELLSGCDLLITTPPCFERLIECDVVKVIDREKIKYLAFDNFDVMYEKFKKEVARIFKRFVGCTPAKESKVQLIITSTKWLESLRSLYVQDYIKIMLIANFSEAAIMARTRFKIVIESPSDKNQNLINRLKNFEWRFRKTLILFNKSSEVQEFKKLLDSQKDVSFLFTALDDNENYARNKTLCNIWQRESSGRMSLLLMTDFVYHIHNIHLENVQVLIHYSLTPSWTEFSHRFAASIGYYKRNINERELPSESERPSSIILLSYENIREFPRLLMFIGDKRLFKQLPDHVIKIIQEIKNSVESDEARKNKNVSLCPNFLKFADDINTCKCEQRHAFIPEDKSTSLPTSGHIKFEVIGIFNPLHYAIKITHTKDIDNSWVSHNLKIHHTENGLKKLQKYMNDNDNVKTAAVIKIGELYCNLDSFTHDWYRCKIISINDKNSDSFSPFDVTILYIDKGERKTVKSTYIRELPEKFKKYDALAVDLRITNMAPYDFDKLFDRESINEVTNQIKKAKHKSGYFICNISLTFGNTIIAQNFHMFQYVKELKTDILQFSLKQFLLKNKLVVIDETIFEKIEISALKAGLFTTCNEHVNQHDTQLKENEIEHLMYSEGDISLHTPEVTQGEVVINKNFELENSENFELDKKEADNYSSKIDEIGENKLNENKWDLKKKMSHDNPFMMKEIPLHIKWWQDNIMVTLKIKTHDIIEYSAHVDKSFVNITFRYPEKYGISKFKLYARIDEDFIREEMKNDALYIYLIKIDVGVTWPRLSLENDKDLFIKPNKSEQMKLLNPDSLIEDFKPAGFSDSELNIQ